VRRLPARALARGRVAERSGGGTVVRGRALHARIADRIAAGRRRGTVPIHATTDADPRRGETERRRGQAGARDAVLAARIAGSVVAHRSRRAGRGRRVLHARRQAVRCDAGLRRRAIRGAETGDATVKRRVTAGKRGLRAVRVRHASDAASGTGGVAVQGSQAAIAVRDAPAAIAPGSPAPGASSPRARAVAPPCARAIRTSGRKGGACGPSARPGGVEIEVTVARRHDAGDDQDQGGAPAPFRSLHGGAWAAVSARASAAAKPSGKRAM
jgi:hypothetical protein